MDLHVKIYYTQASMPSEGECEIRRFSVGRDALTFAGLTDNITSLLPESDFRPNSICWKDSENDYISISSDEELQTAISDVTEDGNLKIYVLECVRSEKESTAERGDQTAEQRGRPRKREFREMESRGRGDRSRKGHRSGDRTGRQMPWVPHMRRGMRRCMARAWILASHGENETEMRPRDLPEEWREWMKSKIRERMCEARKNAPNMADVNTSSENIADEAETKPIDKVPMFWRRGMRHCARQAWAKAMTDNEKDTPDKNADEKNEDTLPLPMRRFMRRVMMNSWQAAKDDAGENTDEMKEKKQVNWGLHRRRFCGDNQFMNAKDRITFGMHRMGLDDDNEACPSPHRPPYWAPHMRRCLRRCMTGAMMAAHNKDKDATSCESAGAKPRDLPPAWRDWMKSEIQQTMTKARQESHKCEQETPADQKEKLKEEPLPEFWRKRIQYATRKTWMTSRRHLWNAENGRPGDDRKFEEMPLPVRQSMRRNMVQFWQRANEGGERNNMASKEGLPPQWRRAMGMGMRRAFIAMEMMKHADMEEMNKQKVCRGKRNTGGVREEVRQATRNAVREAWKKHRENSAQTGDSAHLDPAPQIPVLWRQAMRRSMVKMWRVTHSGDEIQKNNREAIPEPWRNFMRRNIQLSWRKAGVELHDAEPTHFEKPRPRIHRRLVGMHKRRAFMKPRHQNPRIHSCKRHVTADPGAPSDLLGNRGHKNQEDADMADVKRRFRMRRFVPGFQFRRRECREMFL